MEADLVPLPVGPRCDALERESPPPGEVDVIDTEFVMRELPDEEYQDEKVHDDGVPQGYSTEDQNLLPKPGGPAEQELNDSEEHVIPPSLSRLALAVLVPWVALVDVDHDDRILFRIINPCA